MSLTAIWLLLCALCLILEMFTISFLLFFPGVGAFLAFLTSLVTDTFGIQLFVFITSSTLMIIFIRPIIAKLFKSKTIATNSNSLIGKSGIVLKDIVGKDTVGQVKVAGEVWSAICDEKLKFKKDSKIIVESIEGVKLIVKDYTE